MKKKPTKKKPTTALAVRQTKASPMQAIMADAMKALAVPVPKVDPDYSIAMFRREHVMWQVFTAKDGSKTTKPFVINAGLVDGLSQVGYKIMQPVGMPMSRPCTEAGCRGALDVRKGDKMTDYQQVVQFRVVLKNGKDVTMTGTACKHNSQMKGERWPELAETRAQSRAIGRAINSGVCAIVELKDLDSAATWKLGDRVLASSQLGQVIEAEFTAATGQGPGAEKVATETAKPAPAPAAAPQAATAAKPTGVAPMPEPATDQTAGTSDAEWVRGSAALHKRAEECRMTTEELHAHVYDIGTKTLDRMICSLKDLTGPEMWSVVGYFRKLTPKKVEVIKAWFKEEGQQVLDSAKATIRIRQGQV